MGVVKTKRVLVVYNCDNGYTCSCCGNSWEESEIKEIPKTQKLIDFFDQETALVQSKYTSRYGGRASVKEMHVISESYPENT